MRASVRLSPEAVPRRPLQQRGCHALCLLVGCLAAGSAPAAGQPSEPCGYVPHRVYAPAAGGFTDFEAMLADLAQGGIVFVGERHGEAAVHRLQHAMLDGLARRRDRLVLALEMFERDVQPVLDDYLSGRLTEETFLAAARPWPRYATDYRPLVETAKARGWPVLASNVSRPLAEAVAAGGLAALDELSASERTVAARELRCPVEDDEYFRRFEEAMASHPIPEGEEDRPAAVRRMYEAQCLKDETMAESAVQAYRDAAGEAPLVFHVNGAFHSDFHLGSAARTTRRAPDARTIVVSLVLSEDLDRLDPAAHHGRADYVVFSLQTPQSLVPNP